jgi:hypothetical protein
MDINGNPIIDTDSGRKKTINIVEFPVEGISTTFNGDVLTNQTTFVNNQEFVTKLYVDSQVGMNPFDQDLNTTDAVTFSSVNATTLTQAGIPVLTESIYSNSTGVIEGGLTTLADPDTVSITGGTGIINYNDIITSVSWNPITSGPLTVPINFVYVDVAGAISINQIPPTAEKMRSDIFLSAISVEGGIITDILHPPMPLENQAQTIYDFARSLGIFNVAANIFTFNGANMNIDKSGLGKIFSIGANFQNVGGRYDPSVVEQPILTIAPFRYSAQSPAGIGPEVTVIDSANYDLNGVITPITGPTNTWQIQYIYMNVNNDIQIEYGQTISYTSIEQALDAIGIEDHIKTVQSNGYLLRGYLVLKKDTTDLSNTTDNRFVEAGRFGSSSISGGTSSFTDLQTAYNNSLTKPQIVTTALGSVQIKNGDVDDTLTQFEVLDNSNASVFSVTADGKVNTIDGNILPSYSEASTGVIEGGHLTLAGGVGTSPNFNISAGKGIITNKTTGVVTEVSWDAQTPVTPLPTYNGILTWVHIDANGDLTYSDNPPSDADDRNEIDIGVLVHTGLPPTNLDAVNNEQSVVTFPANQLRDLMNALGFINIEGNLPSSPGGLKISKSEGKILAHGSNHANDELDPHRLTLAAIDTTIGTGINVFQYRFQDGTSSDLTLTDFDFNLRDTGTFPGGTIGTQKWGLAYVFSFTSNALKIQPTQEEYNTVELAEADIGSASFTIEPSIKTNGLLIGYIVHRGGGIDLADPADALFLSAGKFGAGTGGGVLGGTQNLQSVYDNSTTQPQITVDDANNGLVLQNGQALDTDNVLEVKDISTATTFSVSGAGDVDAVTYKESSVSGTIARTIGSGASMVISNEPLAGGLMDSGGNNNILYGQCAGESITSADNNTCIGNDSGTKIVVNNNSTFVGQGSGLFMTGGGNTAVGQSCLKGVDGDSGGQFNVAIGQSALTSLTTADDCVAVGQGSLLEVTTGRRNVGVGRYSGRYITTGFSNTCLGYNSGPNTGFGTSNYNIAIGRDAKNTNGTSNQMMIGGIGVTAISEIVPGVTDTTTDLGSSTLKFKDAHLAGEVYAGNLTTTEDIVHIGSGAGGGVTPQATNTVAIGTDAGSTGQGIQSVAIGNGAGETDQQTLSVAIGNVAGRNNQKTGAVAVGHAAGRDTQASYAVAIGYLAGLTSQKTGAVAIGQDAGLTTQASKAVAIGYQAGNNDQKASAVAIGDNAGLTTQGLSAVSIGAFSGITTQGLSAVCIGNLAGNYNQGVSIGKNSGKGALALNDDPDYGLPPDSVAIGVDAFLGTQELAGDVDGSAAVRITPGFWVGNGTNIIRDPSVNTGFDATHSLGYCSTNGEIVKSTITPVTSFAPTFIAIGANFTQSLNTSSYTIQGKLVTFNFSLSFSKTSSSSGDVAILLPFISLYDAPVTISRVSQITYADRLTGMIEAGQQAITLYSETKGGTNTEVIATDVTLTTTGTISGSVQYFIA